MRARPLRFVASYALTYLAIFGGCQSSPLGAGDMGGHDALGPDAGADTFAAQVTAANASCGPDNCVVALSSTDVADGAAVHAAVGAFVAKWAATSVDNLQAKKSDCGSPNHADCATTLQHDLFKGDGCRGAAITPLAMQVVTSSQDVEEVAWTPVVDGISQQPFVTLAGRTDGRLVGLAFGFGRACPAQ